MFNQGGIGVGTPKRPDYPYTIASANKKNRLCIYVAIGVAALMLYYSLGFSSNFDDRESQIRKIHYATAMGAVGLVILHILVRFSTENFV